MRSEGAWTLGAVRDAARQGGRGGGRGPAGRGRGRGRGGSGGSHFGHDDRLRHVARSDNLKQKHTGRGPKGKGKGRGKGKGKGSFDDDDDVVVPIVNQCAEESMGKHCEVKKAHGSAITSMVMTGDAVYTGSADKSLKRWKPVAGPDGRFTLEPDATVPLPESCCSLLHHQGWIFCGLFNGTIQAFSQDGTSASLKGHTRRVSDIIVHQNVVISGSADREVRLWQLVAGNNTFQCTHTIRDDMPGPISRLRVMGGSLYVGGLTGLAVVNLETLKVSKLLPPTKPVVDFLECQEHLIVAYSEGSLRIFKSDGTMTHETKALAAGQMFSLAGLEKGPRVLCGHARGQVCSIMLPSFELKTSFQAFNTYCKVETIYCPGENGIFFLGASDGSLQMWQRIGE